MSYTGREESSNWDIGPPGAESDYTQPTSYPAQVQPGPDQWSTATYSQYANNFNYPTTYGYTQPAYGYDPNYYHNYSDADYAKYSIPLSAYSHCENTRPPKTEYRRSRSPSESRFQRKYKARSHSRTISRSPSSSHRSRKYSRRYSSSVSRSRSNSYKRKQRLSSRSSRDRRSSKSYSRSLTPKAPRKCETPPLKKMIKVEKEDVSERKCKSKAAEPKIKPVVSKTLEKVAKGRKQRESSLEELPKSYTTRHRTSSESSSSSVSSKSRSVTPKKKRKFSISSQSSRSQTRSPSRSSSCSRSRSMSSSRNNTRPKKHYRKRGSSSKSTTPPGISDRSRGGTPVTKSKKMRNRSKSGSRSLSSNSSDGSSRRGHFDTQDRKKYFKKYNALKEAAEKEKQTKVDKVHPIKEELKKIEQEEIVYKEPSPIEGVNFEDLPPPPVILETGKKSSTKTPFKNDGSFLEMFKKMQEANKKPEVKIEEKKTEIKKPALPFIGKRRGGRILKTGLVKKAKSIEEQLVDNTPKDAWSLYMQEVKKYRETSCEEERKTRPLVK